MTGDDTNDEGTRARPLHGDKPPKAPSARTVHNLSLDQTAIPSTIGRFQIRDLLGEGAFGRVFLGVDPELERQVAIKVPRLEGFTRELRDRFIREARATAKIHHPNVCPVYEVHSDGEMPYIVMHYLAGTTLAAHLDEVKLFPPMQAVALVQRLALGMAAAHAQDVIHRDLKPQNILFDPSRQLVQITDFGLARFGNQAHITAAGSVFGTPTYMSPEQARGKIDEVGPLSDVYSLGVILFRMLTGEVPFSGTVYEVLLHHCETPPPKPSSVLRGLDPRLDAIVLKAIEKVPANRYTSAKEFAKVLGEYQRSGEPTAWVASEATRADDKLEPVSLNSETQSLPTSGSKRPGPPPLPPGGTPSAANTPKVPNTSPPATAGKKVPQKPVTVKPLSHLYDDPAKAGASRGKKLARIAIVLLLLAGAGAGVFAYLNKKPTETAQPPATTPPDTPPVTPPEQKKDPVVVPPKKDPPKELPSIANGFAGHAFDQAAERRTVLWAISVGVPVLIEPIDSGKQPKGFNPLTAIRSVNKPEDLPPAFTVAYLDFQRKGAISEADILANLAGLSGPLQITFRECPQVTNETIIACGRVPKLKQLHLVKMPAITDTGIATLVKHPTLEQVTISRTGATKAAVKTLVTLPSLTGVECDVPEADEWLADLVKQPNLTKLILSAHETYDVTERGLRQLRSLRKLRYLGLHGRKITDEWLSWVADLGTLERLELWNSRLEGAGLASLKKLTELRTLDLEDAFISEAALAHVADFRVLETLNLTGSNATDDGVFALAKSETLRKLTVTNTRVTTEGVRELRTKIPNCTIINL